MIDDEKINPELTKQQWLSPPPASDRYMPQQWEQDHVSYVENKVRMGDDARQQYLINTWLNYAFLLGEQWCVWAGNGVSGRLQRPAVNPWQVMAVNNFVLPIVQTAVGKLTQGDPGWIVMPWTDEEQDAQRARACKALLECLHQSLGMSTKGADFVRWGLVAGLGIFRVKWCDDGGPGGIPFPDVQPVSPLQVIFDPGCERGDLSDCQWAAEQAWENIDALRQRYPEKGPYLVPDSQYASDNLGMQLKVRATMLGISGDPSVRDLDRVRVVYYYERPSKMRPDGVYAVVACGMVLRLDVLPLKKLPFVVYRHNAPGGRLYGDGMVNAMRGPQTEINKYHSILMEILDLTGTPKWSVEKGSVVMEVSFTREPGEIIEYEQGSRPPEPLPAPPISSAFSQQIESSRATLQEVSGISEISQGVATTNLSGRAAQRMAELDATKFGPTVAEIEAAYGALGCMLLELWREYADDTVTLRMLGENNRPEVLVFNKDQITSLDVRILPGSMRVRHPSVEQEKLMMVFERGGLGSPQDPKVLARFQKAMAIGDSSLEEGHVAGETTYAREENWAIQNGEGEPKVLPTDDHEAHIAVHKAMLQTDDVRFGGTAEAFLEHIAQHEAYLAAERGAPIPAWVSEYVPDLVAVLQPPPPQEAPPPGSGGGPMLRPTAMPFDGAGGVGLGEAPPVNLSAETSLPPALAMGPGVSQMPVA